ncbi:MAG: hypothetical protein ACO1OX_11735 [Novosphingobium sp.]
MTLRVVAPLFAIALLEGCSARFEISPCRLGGALAFEVEHTSRWFFSTPRKIWRALVYQRGPSDFWEINDLRATHHSYSIVPYAAKLKGWNTVTPARALDEDATYTVLIVGDIGDFGETEFIPRDVTNQCRATDQG